MTAERIIAMEIFAGLAITGGNQKLIVGNAFSVAYGETGGLAPFLFSYTGSIPASITPTVNPTNITFAGTPIGADAGNYPITITLRDANRVRVMKNVTISIVALPLSLSGHAGNMRIGDSDTYAYTATGGYGGNSFTITSGSLPPGCTLDPTTGVLTRVPTTAGNYSWVVTVTDSASDSVSLPDSCAIGYPLATISGAFAPYGVVGVYYQSDVDLVGGDGTWSNPQCTTANLPAGLALSIVSGPKLRLSGTPLSIETDSITVTADTGDGQTATHSQSVTEDAALTISGAFPTLAGTGTYSQKLLLGGGDGTYSLGNGGTGLASGTLPTGGALSVVLVSGSYYVQLDGPFTAEQTATFTLSIDSGDGQNVTSPQSIAVASLTSIRTKITSWWGFNSTVNDTGRAGNNFSGSISYVTGVGGRNALAPTAGSINTSGSNGCLGQNAYHGTNKFTFGGFLKPSQLAKWHAVLGGTSGLHEGVFISSVFLGTANKWTVGVRNSATTNFVVSSTTNAVVGTLAHVMLEADGTNLNIYINGVLENSTPMPTTALNYANASRFILGTATDSNGGSTPNSSYAQIQDMFWAHAVLTAEEKAWLINGGSGRAYSDFGSASYGTTHDTVMAALSPTGFWKLNQTSGTTATDSGSLGNGTMTNGALFSNAVALPAGFGTDYSAFFDGSNDYLSLPAVNYSSGSLSYVQLGWFYPITLTDTFASYMWLSTGSGSTNYARMLVTASVITSSQATFRNSVGSSIVAVTGVTDPLSSWRLLAAVYDDTNKTLLLVENGLVIAGAVASSGPPAANCTWHSVGGSSGAANRLSMRAARLAHFKGATVSLPNLAELNDLGRGL